VNQSVCQTTGPAGGGGGVVPVAGGGGVVPVAGGLYDCGAGGGGVLP